MAGFANGQETEIPDKGPQLKFDVLTFASGLWQEYPGLKLSFQYEQQIPWDQKTFTFSYYYSQNRVSNGSSLYDHYFRLELRHYFSKTPYQGFFVGAFPIAHISNHGPALGQYYGGGLIVGCQFAITKRLRFENTYWYAGTWGSMIHNAGSVYVPSDPTDYKPIGSIEFSIGWMLRKQK